MNYFSRTVLAIVLSLASFSGLFAIPATPFPVKILQPDGTEITVRLHGDEFFSYKTTTDGYLLIEDRQGIHRYAKVSSAGKLESTDFKANEIGKRTLKERRILNELDKHVNFQKIAAQNRASRISSISKEVLSAGAYPLTGSPKSLVILVNFADKNFVVPNPKEAFTNLLNENGYTTNGGTGSARDYFRDASNGKFSPHFDVVGPYSLPQNIAYYGENDADDQDKNPRQMVVDACRLADQNGIDFTEYDTDNDGIVDNVFIYYAGYNEAEGGPKNTVWPHRWALPNYNTKFDGKSISDYACTSELKGSRGENMCGIGTFCHEFGHVLGLPDYYATDNSEHLTLNDWNIMDAGAYLNSGRTPPTYSAYDRFFLDWLQPIELKSSQNVTLEPLLESNKAYLITQNGNHNMNGANPSPLEFFILENRQKKGWDAYLPGKGLLVTRINYNKTTWNNNTPNNKPNEMGVDIVEANGNTSKKSSGADPFPGTANKTSYDPELRNGTKINKPLTFIKEEDGIISFRFMGGGNVPLIMTSAADLLFQTVHGTPSVIQELKVFGSTLKDSVLLSFSQKTQFEMKLSNDVKWVKEIVLSPVDSLLDTTVISIRYNPTEPSFSNIHKEMLNFTSKDAETLKVILTGVSTRQVYVTAPVAIEATHVTEGGFVANWNKVYDASGYYLTVYSLSEGNTFKNEGFKNGLTASPGWTINASSVTKSKLFSGDSIPAILFEKSDEFVETELFLSPVVNMSVYLKSLEAKNGHLWVQAWDGSVWDTIENVSVNTTLAGIKQYNFNASDNYLRFRFTYKKGEGSLALDDVRVGFDKKLDIIYSDKWVTANADTVNFLVPGTSYFYKMKASDKTLNFNKTIKYENITDFSNLIKAETLMDGNPEKLRSIVLEDGKVLVILVEKAENLYVYNSVGSLVRTVQPTQNTITLEGLPTGQMYILKAGKRRSKIVLL